MEWKSGFKETGQISQTKALTPDSMKTNSGAQCQTRPLSVFINKTSGSWIDLFKVGSQRKESIGHEVQKIWLY